MKKEVHIIKSCLIFVFLFIAGTAIAGPMEKSLFDAAKSGDAAGIRELVKKHVDVNARDTDGDTPLLRAAAKAEKTRRGAS